MKNMFHLAAFLVAVLSVSACAKQQGDQPAEAEPATAPAAEPAPAPEPTPIPAELPPADPAPEAPTPPAGE